VGFRVTYCIKLFCEHGGKKGKMATRASMPPCRLSLQVGIRLGRRRMATRSCKQEVIPADHLRPRVETNALYLAMGMPGNIPHRCDMPFDCEGTRLARHGGLQTREVISMSSICQVDQPHQYTMTERTHNLRMLTVRDTIRRVQEIPCFSSGTRPVKRIILSIQKAIPAEEDSRFTQRQ
jgi:hypothetical protein